MKSMLLLFSLTVGTLALAQESSAVATPVRSSSEIEVTCRAKAKEIAAETYKGCVTEQKNAQVEQIKKDYQAKLNALKAHYESELKKLNASKIEKLAAEGGVSEDMSVPAEVSAEKPADVKTPKKSDSVPATKPAPVKKTTTTKTTAKDVAAPKKAASKKAPVKTVAAPTVAPSAESASANEMTVQLKPAPVVPMKDESTMDLPEPIPVETTGAEASI